MAQGAASEDPVASELLGREFATAVVMFHEAVGRLLGLSAVERKCLDVLRRLGPVTAGTIGEHTGLTTGAVTGLMDRLEKAGYVERGRDPHDRRKVVVRLLPNERMDALLATAIGPFADEMTTMAAKYSDAERRTIADWVRGTTDVLVANTQRILNLDQP
ncbi:MarR family winged helix-turn-helix transcriptional regulator [Rugosimonospora africana]|uniref:MarR family transcriptional regulator n=1 Tax=Rugosimonospora africana TaxID=556532 RepID=A0A8J3R0A2_9ACTN|nr:MarR family transcriptional regulator [Rugosimonospora africana]GIH19499.1 MarR family transcriptional regulator [Rugosimonospora africana]